MTALLSRTLARSQSAWGPNTFLAPLIGSSLDHFGFIGLVARKKPPWARARRRR